MLGRSLPRRFTKPRYLDSEGPSVDSASEKIRVLFVLRCGQFGGMERYVLDIVNALVSDGRGVSVLLTNEDADAVPSLFVETLHDLGAELIIQYFSISKVESKFFNRRFSKILDDVRPNVVFFNRSGGLGWSKFADLIITARLKRIARIVVAEHGHPAPFPTRKGHPFYTFRKRLHCWLQARCLNAIVCMNSAARELLVTAGYSYPRKRTHVIYNGVDMDRFVFDPALRTSHRDALDLGSKTLVLYCGRLSFEKGSEVLLDAWQALGVQKRQTLFLLIVGDGKMMTEMQDAVDHMGLRDSVKFMGFQPDVLGYLCACDIFVLPSHMESFGLSLVEAMSVGRYVIATNVGGVPELLSEPDIGALIASNSHEFLAKAIWKAASDPDLRMTTGAKAKKFVHQKFALQRTTERTLAVLLGETKRFGQP